MKKVLLLTDGSVEGALALNSWQQTHPEPIALTVVYAFAADPLPGQSLTAATYDAARQTAQLALTQWLNMLSPVKPAQLRTEIMLGSPSLVLTMYLVLRQYDYVLLDAHQPALLSAFRACQPQIRTQLQHLRSARRSLAHLQAVTTD